MIPVWLQRLFRDPREGGVLGINRRNLDLVFSEYRPGKFRSLDDKLIAKDVMEEAVQMLDAFRMPKLDFDTMRKNSSLDVFGKGKRSL